MGRLLERFATWNLWWKQKNAPQVRRGGCLEWKKEFQMHYGQGLRQNAKTSELLTCFSLLQVLVLKGRYVSFFKQEYG